MTALAEGEEVRIRPTIIARSPDADTVGFVTVTFPGVQGEALIVFGGPEDARGYQEATGKHTARDGYKIIVGMDAGALADVLDSLGAPFVAVPESPWTGEGGVDFFDAAEFVAMLEESAGG